MRPNAWWAAAAVWLGAASAGAQGFTDVTVSSGVVYEQFTGQSAYLGEEFYMTGGAAAADVDGDGWVDLYVTRMKGADVLFHNDGGVFSALSPASTGLDAGDGSNGAIWGDIDDDGDLDLYVTTVGVGRNWLFVNEGGVFSEQASARGAAIVRSARNPVAGTFGATFGDYDGDGYLDLHVCAWSDRGGEGSRLLRNVGSQAPGTFVDVTEAAGVALDEVPNSLGLADIALAFSSQFVDLDQDGRLDLVVAGDFGTSRVFFNDGDGTFTDGTAAAGFGSEENGMGLACGDVDGDGFLDLFVTSIFDPLHTCNSGLCTWGDSGNRLYRYQGGRTFADWTATKGVADGGWGWGAAFLDADRDMDLDLVMTNGFDDPAFPWEDDLFHDDPMRLWRNEPAASWPEEASAAGLTATGDGKALVTLDVDRDGDLDVFVVHNADPPALYRNDSTGHWLQVELAGILSDRQGLGARIDVIADGKLQSRLVASGGYLSDSEKIATFGLGAVTTIDEVRVQWPRGGVQLVSNVAADQRLTIVEDVGGSTPAPAASAALALSPPFPNPFNPRTVLELTLAEPGPATVTVYDARGRMVSVLHRGRLEAGRHRLTWEGVDAHGVPMASGVYYLELRTGGHRVTRAAELLR